MMFLFPLIVAIIATAVFMFADEDADWKKAAVMVLVMSLILQFVYPTYFIISLLMQVVLSVAILTYYKIS